MRENIVFAIENDSVIIYENYRTLAVIEKTTAISQFLEILRTKREALKNLKDAMDPNWDDEGDVIIGPDGSLDNRIAETLCDARKVLVEGKLDGDKKNKIFEAFYTLRVLEGETLVPDELKNIVN